MKLNKHWYLILGLIYFVDFVGGILGLRFTSGLSKLGWLGYSFLAVLGLLGLYRWATFENDKEG